jgi:hypothetical protein
VFRKFCRLKAKGIWCNQILMKLLKLDKLGG